MKKSIVFGGRESIGCQCKQKKISRRRYHCHFIKWRKPFPKFHHLWNPNSGGRNIFKKLNFPTKKNLLPSDKSSTPKVRKRTFFKTKTQNCLTGELASKKTKSDIMNNDSQKHRSEKTAESDTIKSLPKSITIRSIKYSNIFIQSIFKEPIPLIKNIEASHSHQST